MSFPAPFPMTSKTVLRLLKKKNFYPYPPPSAAISIGRQIWQIFDPSPPKKCRRCKWMVPYLDNCRSGFVIYQAEVNT